MLTLPDILKGAKVFPIVPGTKDPATTHGWHEATNDPAQIQRWLNVNPDWNWAVACGMSDLFVFDIDPNGLDWWAKLLERDPVIKSAVDRAFQVRTPKGGLHVYFRGEGPSTASRIADGIDTRGGIKRNGKIVSGGYVLLPGSKTKAGPGRVDGAYNALPGGTIEPLPDFMAAIVPARKKTDTLGLDRNPEHDQPRNISWAKDLIDSYVKSGRVSIEGKGGNNLAFQVAASILDKAVSPGMCFDLLWEHWNPHCQPPWDDFELETVIRNAASYAEDAGGVKGFQSNADAFANFVGMETPELTAPVAERNRRSKLKWLSDYADSARDPEWLLPGYVPAHGIGMLYGASGSYKSFVALDWALCLANGIAGQWGAPPVKNDVLFLAGEGPNATAKKRWPAWNEWQGVEFRNDNRFIILDFVPSFNDIQEWENIKADLAELKARPALIVIDTATRLNTGLDENSANDMTKITNFMEQLAHYYECSVMVIHHTGKDESKGARGSSALFANMDFAISTKKVQDGTMLTVRKQKDADVSDENRYLKVVEVGQSIVLAHSDEKPNGSRSEEKKPRYDWASREELTALLNQNGGEMSHSVLVQEIMRIHGLDRALVQKQLKAHDLHWLRPSDTVWRIPTIEHDL